MSLVKSIVENNSKFTRSFESMGKGLLFIRVDSNQESKPPFHYLFEDGKKPPFDIAINPSTNMISYFKYFLQDEEIDSTHNFGELNQMNGDVVFSTEKFSDKTYQIFEEAEFETSYQNDNLYIVRKGHCPERAVCLAEGIKILIDKKGDFVGVIFDSIVENEIQEFYKSQFTI